MRNDQNSFGDNYQRKKNVNSNSVSGSIYGFAFIGSLIYYIQHATSFGMGVLGFLKSLVWPAVMIYKLMEFLKM